MNYFDGRDARLGDKVQLCGDIGVVVCSIDTGEYSDDYPEAAWSYLKKGVMISFPKYGLVHYEEPEPELQLVSRARP